MKRLVVSSDQEDMEVLKDLAESAKEDVEALLEDLGYDCYVSWSESSLYSFLIAISEASDQPLNFTNMDAEALKEAASFAGPAKMQRVDESNWEIEVEVDPSMNTAYYGHGSYL